MSDYNILDFLKTFGINTKSNFDLYDYGDFLGLKDLVILMNDELDENLENKCIIVNIQNSDKNGNHWCCIYNKKYYFDSFGINPTKEVERFLDENYVYNSLQVQPFNTNICGVLCLYVLYNLFKTSFNKDFEDIILEIYENLEILF